MAYVNNDGIDGTATAGRKGLPYDWQLLLVPTEPKFSTELQDLLNTSVSTAGTPEGSIV